MAQFNAGNLLSGGLGGAGLYGSIAGAAAGPLGYGLSALAGGLMGAFGGGEGGLEQGYDIVQMPQWSWNEGFQRNLSDYLSGGLQSMQQGQPAPWWQKAEPIMRAGMMRGLNESMYGRPGERTGAMQQAADLGAITGVGPKATWAQGRKLLGDYMDKSAQIDEYLTSLGVNVRQQSEQTYLQGALNAPQGPPSTVVNKMGGVYGPQGPSPWTAIGQTVAGMPWNTARSQAGQGQTGGYWQDLGMDSSGLISQLSQLSQFNPQYTWPTYQPIPSYMPTGGAGGGF